jgi:hypothetical protein
MAREFEKILGPEGQYLGFDVHSPSIVWCRQRFAADERFRFELAEVSSPYGSVRGAEARDYRFPCGAGSRHLVIAKSVFTHLLPPQAERYLSEIARVLSPGGRGWITAFVFTGEPTPFFRHRGDDPGIRWRRRLIPEAAVAYERSLFEQMIGQAGLRVLEMIPGFWPGRASRLSGQDSYLLARIGL